MPRQQWGIKKSVVLVELLWHVRVGMMFVEEFDGMETTAVDVEMDVAAVEIWRACLPDFNLRMKGLNGFPDCLSDALALNSNFHIEEGKFALMSFFIDDDDSTTHSLAVCI